MNTLFLDFETFFGPVEIPGEFVGVRKKRPKMFNLSLKNPKLSYTDYVRHPEFEVLGVSMMWENDDEPVFIRKDSIPEVFAHIDWATTRVVAHNAVFDGLVMHETYGIVPAEYFCTMACAEAIYQGAVPVGLDALGQVLGVGQKSPDLQDFRGKHASDLSPGDWEKLARYANNDTNIMVGIYNVLSAGLPDDEKRLMDMTIKLFADPVLRVDVDMAQQALDDAIDARDTLVAKTGLTKEQISGNITFENALRDELGWIPQKVNKNGETKPAFAKTDLEFVRLLSHPSDTVKNLVRARQEVKSSLGITRAERLLALGSTGSGRCNVCLHYGRAHTLRWTGGNKMNFQNFTRGSKLRKAIIAPEGCKLGVVDSSQIECRVLAAIAGQEDLVEIFRSGGDPYSIMASKVYGFEVNKKDHPVERFMGKTMVLGLGYGMGWLKFWNEIVTGARGMALDIDKNFAKKAVQIYRDANDKIMAFHKTAESWLWYLLNETNPKKEVLNGLITLDPATKRVIFPNGCYLRYPELSNDEGTLMYKAFNVKTKRYEWKKIYGGLFVENMVQALARHIVATQILGVAEKYRTVLFVHDECVFLIEDITNFKIPTRVCEEAMEFANAEFRKKPWWLNLDIPLDSEGGYDRSYSK